MSRPQIHLKHDLNFKGGGGRCLQSTYYILDNATGCKCLILSKIKFYLKNSILVKHFQKSIFHLKLGTHMQIVSHQEIIN